MMMKNDEKKMNEKKNGKEKKNIRSCQEWFLNVFISP